MTGAHVHDARAPLPLCTEAAGETSEPPPPTSTGQLASRLWARLLSAKPELAARLFLKTYSLSLMLSQYYHEKKESKMYAHKIPQLSACVQR